MTDEFPHDPDLADALRSHSGGDVALSDARAAVLGRATTIRRRRLAAVTSAAVLVVGGVALTAGVGRGDPADEPIALELPGTSTTGVDGADDSPGATSTRWRASWIAAAQPWAAGCCAAGCSGPCATRRC